LTPYHDPAAGKFTLFMQGHAQKDGKVAQVEVPASFVKSSNWASLPMAVVRQTFADVTDGKLGTAGDTYNGMPVYGMLVYNSRLIVGVAQAYGSNQIASHGVSTLNLSATNDFKGFYPFNASRPASVGRHMTPIPAGGSRLWAAPPDWQLLSVHYRATSSGPSVTVFNPNSVGTANRFRAARFSSSASTRLRLWDVKPPKQHL
jgi:hypothetical protein